MRRRINKLLLHFTSPNRIEKLKGELTDIKKKIQLSHKQNSIASELKAINAIKKNTKYFYSYMQTSFAKPTLKLVL